MPSPQLSTNSYKFQLKPSRLYLAWDAAQTPVTVAEAGSEDSAEVQSGTGQGDPSPLTAYFYRQ